MDIVALLAEAQPRDRVANRREDAAVHGKCYMMVVPGLAGELFDIEVDPAPVEGRATLDHVLYL